MATALFILMALPITMLFVGALLAELPLDDQLPDYLRGDGRRRGAAPLVLAGIGLVIAAMTPRRGLGVAAVIGVLLVLVRASRRRCGRMAEEFGNDTFAGYAGLFSPFTLVDGVMAGPFGAESVMATPPDGVLMGAVFCLAAVAGRRRLLRRPAGAATGRPSVS